MRGAASNGRLASLRFGHLNGFPYDWRVEYNAMQSRAWQCYRYAREHLKPKTARSLDVATSTEPDSDGKVSFALYEPRAVAHFNKSARAFCALMTPAGNTHVCSGHALLESLVFREIADVLRA
jgi:hypothetical protein